jgi:hypothetical protein
MLYQGVGLAAPLISLNLIVALLIKLHPSRSSGEGIWKCDPQKSYHPRSRIMFIRGNIKAGAVAAILISE